MDEVIVQPMGGFTGGTTSNMKTEGRIAMSALSAEDRGKVEALFSGPAGTPSNFYYQLTRKGPAGSKTIIVQPDALPDALIQSIKTELK
jgi:hypothetical protein